MRASSYGIFGRCRALLLDVQKNLVLIILARDRFLNFNYVSSWLRPFNIFTEKWFLFPEGHNIFTCGWQLQKSYIDTLDFITLWASVLYTLNRLL